MCVKLNVQQLCRVSTLLGAGRVAPGWRIFFPVKFVSRTNSSVVHVYTRRFTPFHFTSQLLHQILRRREEKAFSFQGFLAQFVHVAFKRVVTLSLGPSILLTLWTVKIDIIQSLVHTTPKKFENTTFTGYLRFVFEVNSGREVT